MSAKLLTLDRERIAAMRHEGAAIDAIAKALNVSNTPIRRILREMGVPLKRVIYPEKQRANSLKYHPNDPRRRRPRKVTREMKDMIIRLYRSGFRGGKLAKRMTAMGMPISKSHVWKVLKTCGEPRRPRGWKGDRCVDCGKRTQGKMRCDLHAYIRTCELQREWAAENTGKHGRGPRARPLRMK